jgi:HPt (histidine-containing phosphotransfer) domain-containing protein
VGNEDSNQKVATRARRSQAATALLPKFIANRERDLGELRVALAQRDLECVARLGHNMRGNGASYGFPDISAIGERLETAAHVDDEPQMREALEALELWVAARQTVSGR